MTAAFFVFVIGKGLRAQLLPVQAGVERERRAKVVNAEGEFPAAEKMVHAAMMSKEPIALQLRFLQTMREISNEHNTMTFLPVPIDLFALFTDKGALPKS